TVSSIWRVLEPGPGPNGCAGTAAPMRGIREDRGGTGADINNFAERLVGQTDCPRRGDRRQPGIALAAAMRYVCPAAHVGVSGVLGRLVPGATISSISRISSTVQPRGFASDGVASTRLGAGCGPTWVGAGVRTR